MSVSEPLALARATETKTSAQDINSAHSTQEFASPLTSYVSVHFPPIGSPAFTEWAQHDSINGHAANALLVLQFIEPSSFADPDTRESLEGIRRRLMAIVELAR